MPRSKQSTKTIARFSESTMREAVFLVIKDSKSIRFAGKAKGLAFQTLSRYVKKFKNDPSTHMRPKYDVNRIFSLIQEQELAKYIITCAKMFYGLTIADCRRLAFEMATINDIPCPENWKIKKMASIDWINGFRKRHPTLSLRTPEGCSLSRATSFNEHNVNMFFDKLETVMKRSSSFSDGTRVFNLDETGTVTVQKSQKVLAERGVKQVSKMTSAEKGTLVTLCCIINAIGNSIPPAMIFPRVNFKEHMLIGAPSGTLGLATKGGWMNSECFIKVIKHFIKHTFSSLNNPSLLIMDNHESHLSLEAIELCKLNGVTILTVPPHCTNKLQPLDVGVYKPFQTFYDSALDSWMMCHPGETFTIYNVASCVGIAHERAMTPANIISSFRKTGIFPMDRHVFTEHDFLPSLVTDRPPPQNFQSLIIIEDHVDIFERPKSPNVNYDSPTSLTPIRPIETEKTFQSPKEFRGYSKAGPRKNARQGRQKGKTMIATDTPEKLAIEEKHKKTMSKKHKSTSKTVKKLFRPKKIKDKESDDDDDSELILEDSTDDEDLVSEILKQHEIDHFEQLQNQPNVEDYVLVEFKAKNKVYYIGKILQTINDNQDYEISFLRKSQKITGKFFQPNIPDISNIQTEDIKMILPIPHIYGQTKRQNAFISFEVDFSLLDIR